MIEGDDVIEKYNISSLGSLLPDDKKLDVCNDAKHKLEDKIPVHPKICLYCAYFVQLYNGNRGILGACFNDKSTVFFKSIVPGWGICGYYSFGKYPICKETQLDREAEDGKD